MPFAPITAQNTKLYLQTATSTYALIDGITTLSGSGGENQTIEATAISDTAPRTLPGMPSPQVLEGTVNYLKADTVHAALVTARKAFTKKVFKCVYSDATTEYFDGYVMAFGMPSMSANSAVTTALKITMDGDFRASE